MGCEGSPFLRAAFGQIGKRLIMYPPHSMLSRFAMTAQSMLIVLLFSVIKPQYTLASMAVISISSG